VDEAAEAQDLSAFATDPDRFTFAEMQFREALRMYPAVHSVIRRLDRDLPLDAGTIPKSTLLNVPLCHLLRDPERFPEPSEHRPERWTERPRPGTIETAMFGGGQHFCLGYHIAIAEGTIFNLVIARALGAHDRRLSRNDDGPIPAPIYLPLAHPPRTAAVRFTRRT
jgi:cytochrome P450 monooxygenase